MSPKSDLTYRSCCSSGKLKSFRSRPPASLSVPTAKGTAFWPCPLFRLTVGLPHRRRNRLFHAGFAQKLRRFFRRRGINVEARAPLESSRLGQLRHELHVPVVVIVGRVLCRRSMDHQIVRRII